MFGRKNDITLQKDKGPSNEVRFYFVCTQDLQTPSMYRLFELHFKKACMQNRLHL